MKSLNVHSGINAYTGISDPDNKFALDQWLALVNERNQLEEYESDLNLRRRELELEQEHSRLQNELRELMATGQSEKTREDLQVSSGVARVGGGGFKPGPQPGGYVYQRRPV